MVQSGPSEENFMSRRFPRRPCRRAAYGSTGLAQVQEVVLVPCFPKSFQPGAIFVSGYLARTAAPCFFTTTPASHTFTGSPIAVSSRGARLDGSRMHSVEVATPMLGTAGGASAAFGVALNLTACLRLHAASSSV